MTDSDWFFDVRSRCRLAREARGLTWSAASAATGLSSLPGKIEGGQCRHLYVRQALALCKGYRIAVGDLLEGWEGWDADPPAPPPELPADHPWGDVDDTLWRVRANLRELRARAGVGTPTVAEAAWGRRSLQSTLSRWESGHYRRMDVVRLRQLADYFSVTLESILMDEL